LEQLLSAQLWVAAGVAVAAAAVVAVVVVDYSNV
jgi:hypothetical protein